MKKRRIKKLELNRETLRNLDGRELAMAAGGEEAGCLTRAGCQTATCPGNCTNSCVTCVVTQCSQFNDTEACLG